MQLVEIARRPWEERSKLLELAGHWRRAEAGRCTDPAASRRRHCELDMTREIAKCLWKLLESGRYGGVIEVGVGVGRCCCEWQQASLLEERALPIFKRLDVNQAWQLSAEGTALQGAIVTSSSITNPTATSSLVEGG